MNALSTIPAPMSAIDTAALALALPENMTFDSWLTEGRTLAATKRHMDFLIGDWINFGRQHFPEQIQESLPGLFDDMKLAKRAEKTAAAFPPHLRDASLTFEHHAHVADLPMQEALPLLKQAHDQNLPARKLRVQAMLRKVETGQVLPREDDPEDDELLACVRAWNRARTSVREDFAEMVAESGFGIIEP